MAAWEGVNEFVAVVEANSFTGAAKKLATSVVHVSRKVSALEARLAVKLLNRTTRKVSVTEAGQTYYQHCRHLVEGLELAEVAITEMQSEPKGILKVTAPVTYGEKFIAPLLSEFLELYPQVNFELLLTNQTLDLIDNNLDIAIRLGHLKDSSLIAKRLSSRQLFIVASPRYLSIHGEPKTLTELSKHHCLVGSVDYWRFREQDIEKNLRISGRMKCNSGVALLDAARRGLGLVQLPDYYVKEALEKGELVEVLQANRDEREGIWALLTERQNRLTKVRLLLDFLAERLP